MSTAEVISAATAISALIAAAGTITYQLRTDKTARHTRTLEREIAEERLELEDRRRRDELVASVTSVYREQIGSLREEVKDLREEVERVEGRAQRAKSENDYLKRRIQALELAMVRGGVDVPPTSDSNQ